MLVVFSVVGALWLSGVVLFLIDYCATKKKSSLKSGTIDNSHKESIIDLNILRRRGSWRVATDNILSYVSLDKAIRIEGKKKLR